MCLCLQIITVFYQVAAAVSGNTHFLMAADEFLEDMRPVSSGRKHQQAIEREV